jgi:hypothetical protein
MFSRIIMGMLAIAALLAAVPASAALITFTVTGNASGAGPLGSFSNVGFTATAVADTTNSSPCSPNCYVLRNNSLVITIAGMGSYQLTNQTVSAVSNTGNGFSFVEVVGTAGVRTLMDANVAANVQVAGIFSTYDLTTNLVGISGGIPIPVRVNSTATSGPLAVPIPTINGALTFISSITGTTSTISNGTFSAVLASPSAVPEISSWVMMLAGFGMLGATLRRTTRATPALA